MKNFQNIGQENIVEEYFKDLNDLSIKNTHEFIEYIEEFENMNLFNEMMKNKQIKKMYYNIKNNYVCTNGLANKFDELQDLNDSQKAYISLINNVPYNGDNRYYQAIHQFYHKHLSDKMGTFELEEIEGLIDNIGKYPSLRIFKKKIECEQNILKPNEELIKQLKTILEVGFSIQHTVVEGFATNIFNYVLSGLCILSTRQKLINHEFKDFKEFLKYIKSFCQLYLINNVYEAVKMKDKDYNLITFIKFKTPGIENEIYNYRYTTADEFCKEYLKYFEKYKKEHGKELKTTLVDDEKGKYILTKYNKKELEDLYKHFDELFQEILKYFDSENKFSNEVSRVNYENEEYNEKIKQFVIEFFQSQCLTRSTCLIGTLMLIILSGKTIKLTGLIDYESILTGKITKYSFEDAKDLDKIEFDFKNLTLSDVLMCFKVLKNSAN